LGSSRDLQKLHSAKLRKLGESCSRTYSRLQSFLRMGSDNNQINLLSAGLLADNFAGLIGLDSTGLCEMSSLSVF
jgi:hypothetical protein